MPQHHRRGENHGRWVGTVGAHDIVCDVPAARLEESEFLEQCLSKGPSSFRYVTYASNVASWDDAWSTNKGGTDVRDNGTVQVGHDHDVELARTRDKLH